MIRTSFVKAVAFAVTLGTVAFTSTSAYALPHFGVHRHISAAKAEDARVSFVLENKCASFRDVKIQGHVYTVLPHQAMIVKAPAGTPVYTETTGGLRHKGDLLFSVNSTMQNAKVAID